ncbi:MAG: hypothetical protein A2072_01555 [Nitrospirae bacterium GWC1_57_7]|nr:MAG: hypothetical protein A2072_01555 [Nitrospirae bacterium GWC1_57_7]OGW46117.1 MAG: hypothetical protein A2X57_03845 [Nitrospirae bacterium GWD2_57_8]
MLRVIALSCGISLTEAIFRQAMRALTGGGEAWESLISIMSRTHEVFRVRASKAAPKEKALLQGSRTGPVIQSIC